MNVRLYRPAANARNGCLGLGIALLALSVTRTATADFYVAPSGSDSNPGTRELPFASLERARDAAKDLKAQAGLPPGGLTIWLRQGIYPRATSFILSATDSGTATSPISYAAAPGETAELFGGTLLERGWFTPVVDGAILKRVISVGARSQLLQCDLKAHGITDYGEFTPRGFGRPAQLAPVFLYVAGRRMTIARWPNPEEHFSELLNVYDKQRRGVVARSAIIDPGPNRADPDYATRGGTFAYTIDRPALWTAAEDLWLDGVFTWSWEWSLNKVKKIDANAKRITLSFGEYSSIQDQYSGDWFYAENLLEEIDQPGEYWLDRTRGLLYLLPNDSFQSANRIHLSGLTAPMVKGTNVTDVTFKSLKFDTGRSSGLILSGERLRVEDCEISNFSATGVSLSGKQNTITGSHIHHVGENGVALNGGNKVTLEPANNSLENSDIHDWGWLERVYRAGASVDGVGQHLSHNRFRVGPHAALLLSGNDHLVEKNDISASCLEFIDLGAVYINVGTHPLERGWTFRQNYIHDIANGPDAPINVEGIYIDHGSHGGLIESNIFHRIGSKTRDSHAVVASGLGTTVQHNIFVDTSYALSVSNKALPDDYLTERYTNYKWASYFSGFPLTSLTSIPHIIKYGFEPFLHRENPTVYRALTADDMWIKFVGNVLWNPNVPLRNPEGIAIRTPTNPVKVLKATTNIDNWVTDNDPGFVDAAGGDLTLRADAPVFANVPGFPKDIDFHDIGLLDDSPGAGGAGGADGTAGAVDSGGAPNPIAMGGTAGSTDPSSVAGAAAGSGGSNVDEGKASAPLQPRSDGCGCSVPGSHAGKNNILIALLFGSFTLLTQRRRNALRCV